MLSKDGQLNSSLDVMLKVPFDFVALEFQDIAARLPILGAILPELGRR